MTGGGFKFGAIFGGGGQVAVAPTDEAILRAARHFAQAHRLCRLDHVRGNSGFTVSLSFNTSLHQTSKADYIEVALRSAHLRFIPSEPDRWSWSEPLKALQRAEVTEHAEKVAQQVSLTKADGSTLAAEASVEASGHLPFIAMMKTAVKSNMQSMRSNTLTQGRASERTQTAKSRWIELERPNGAFDVRLNSPPRDDLVRLNAELDRISILEADEPHSVDPDSVEVVLFPQASTVREITLRIRAAGGTWACLTESRNKAIVSEILLDRLVKASTRRTKLWPSKGGEA